MKVEIKSFNTVDAFAHREVGDYPTYAPLAWQKIWHWADKAGLSGQVTGLYGYGLDNPSTIPPEACRYDACLAISGDVKPSDGIRACTIPGGRYGVYRMKGPYQQMPEVFARMVTQWLPKASEDLDYSRPFLEIYQEMAPDTAPEDYITDLCIPLADPS